MGEGRIISAGTESVSGAVDEKLGLMALRIPGHWKAGSGDTWVSALRDALAWMPAEITGLGLALVKRDIKPSPSGGFEVVFNMDGHYAPSEADGEEFELDGTAAENRIEAHDEIKRLIEKYDGQRKDDGTVTFPLTVSVNGREIENPMHGVKGFYLPSLMWTRNTVSDQFPLTMVRALGCVDTPPTGKRGQRAPTLTGNRNWLKMRAKGTWRGNVWKITESWLLSGPGGWNPDVYHYRR